MSGTFDVKMEPSLRFRGCKELKRWQQRSKAWCFNESWRRELMDSDGNDVNESLRMLLIMWMNDGNQQHRAKNWRIEPKIEGWWLYEWNSVAANLKLDNEGIWSYHQSNKQQNVVVSNWSSDVVCEITKMYRLWMETGTGKTINGD